MSDAPTDGDDIVTVDELADFDLQPQDVRRHCPWAVEYTALDGRPCWLRTHLADLVRGAEVDEP